jgi:hypothetical protein
MEELFGDMDHFISHFGFSQETNNWHSEVYLYGRYRLQMTVKVKVDYKNKTVEQVGEPQFGIFESDRIYDVYEPGDKMGEDVGNQRLFGAKEWDEIYANRGDFSVIGFPLIKDDPVEGFEEFVAGVRKPRLKVLFYPDYSTRGESEQKDR